MELIGQIFIAAFLSFIAVVSIRYHQRRAKMTPEQRKREDREIEDDLALW